MGDVADGNQLHTGFAGISVLTWAHLGTCTMLLQYHMARQCCALLQHAAF